MSIITWIILGLIAGFVGAKLVNREGQGFWLDIALGIVGALVGGFLFALFGASGVTGLEHLQHDCRNRGRSSGAADLQRSNGSPPRLMRASRGSYRQIEWEEKMAGLEDLIRSSAPGGSIAKPLMLALLALLASGALFRGAVTERQLRPQGRNRLPTKVRVACSGDWAGCVDKLQKGGLGDVANSWVGSGQNHPVTPKQLSPALGSEIIKALAQRSGLSEEELTRQLSQILPGVVDKLTPAGRLPTLAELSETK